MTTVRSPKRRLPRAVRDGLADPGAGASGPMLYASSALSARRNPSFSDLESFCFFIGYSRSGHTLIGTALNAHPEVVISHELDAVRYVRHGFRRAQLFSLILQRDQHFGTMGRTWSGYTYDIPDQFQGRYVRLRVLGDKRARSSALQIAGQPHLLDRLRREVGVPIKVLHVTRNPFDNIATEARRHKMSLADATSWYEQICEAVEPGAAAARTRPSCWTCATRRSPPTREGRWPRSAGSSTSNPRPRTSTPAPPSSGPAPTGPATPSPGRRPSGAAWNGSSRSSTCWAPYTFED